MVASKIYDIHKDCMIIIFISSQWSMKSFSLQFLIVQFWVARSCWKRRLLRWRQQWLEFVFATPGLGKYEFNLNFFRVANIDNTIPLLQCPYFHLERAEVFALLKLDLLDLFFPSTANLQYSYNMRWGTCRWVADLLISVFLLSEVHDTPSYKIFTCHFRLLLVTSEWYRFDMNCEQVIWAYKLKQLCQNIGK